MAFVKGTSGNPKGRRPGYMGVQALRDLIGQHAEKVVQRLILSAVNDGDVQAAALLIARAIPIVKPIEMPVKLPLPPDATMADQGRAVVAALARGDLPPGQAGTILSGLASLAKLVELDDHESRLRALEERNTP